MRRRFVLPDGTEIVRSFANLAEVLDFRTRLASNNGVLVTDVRLETVKED